MPVGARRYAIFLTVGMRDTDRLVSKQTSRGERWLFCGQVNLKRKHWDPNASQGRSSKRCTQIFEQQLANAREQGGSQQGTQAAAATQRGEHEGAGRAKGKKALKPWQLKKEKVSQQAAQVINSSPKTKL